MCGAGNIMRLPMVSSAEGLDIAVVGIPCDSGTTNRAGGRHGPREVRNQSSMMRRRAHHVWAVAPFSIANVADFGDLSVNPIDLLNGLKRIEDGMKAIVAAGAQPLCAGEDHLTTLSCAPWQPAALSRWCISTPIPTPTTPISATIPIPMHAVPPRRRGGSAALPQDVVQIGIRWIGL